MSIAADNLQPWTTATVCSVTALALVSIGLRLLSRYETKQKLWWDDWMILFSMAWNLLVVVFIFAMLRSGMGLHAATVPMDSIVRMAKYLLVAEILYVYNLVWTKLSFLMMYYRIFRIPSFKLLCLLIGSFVIAWVICITFLFVFICVPVEKMWYPDLPGKCINQVGTWIANATATIVTDLAILALPIPQIWKLQLRRSEKIAVTIMFSLGFFVVFASAYRFTVLFSYSSNDPTYTLASTVGWTAIEMSAGIISACLPTIQPALYLIARNIGLVRRATPSSSVTLVDSNRSAQTNGDVALKRVISQEHSSKEPPGTGVFYRLSDQSGSVGSVGKESSVNKELRPAGGSVCTVSSVMGAEDLESGHEVSLNRVGV